MTDTNHAEEYIKLCEEEKRLYEESRKHGDKVRVCYNKKKKLVIDWIERNCTECKFKGKSHGELCPCKLFNDDGLYFVANQHLEKSLVDCDGCIEKTVVRKRKQLKSSEALPGVTCRQARTMISWK